MRSLFRTQENISRQSQLVAPKNLDALIERIGDSRYVLLGEASHGTHEYYVWRTEITKRLILEKGFNFIAVEGDWPDAYKINRFIKGYENAGTKIHDTLSSFDRWPTWMWANWEIAALCDWLHRYNQHKESHHKVGFYGLDVYSLWESMNAIINYLKPRDPNAAAIAQRAIECFEPYYNEGSNYARAISRYNISCRDEVVNLLRTIRQKSPKYENDGEGAFNAEQNALIAVNAEKYYKAMLSFGPDSWNIRDYHMMETLNRLMDFHGSGAKAIIWEHNTHIGDARFTDMKNEGMINIGQLTREEHEKEGVTLVGFGSYQGTVIAGTSWGAPMEIKQVPPARPGSIEHYLHNESEEDRIIVFGKNNNPVFEKILPHRAIGVVYNPSAEKYGNYVPTTLAKRYDAFIYLDVTMALHPLHIKPDGHKIPETYPFSF